jgi:2-polyprenyl-3-methyl-5-hydroxy-6-metoxy-1,4-benzoquinol methylase
LRLPINCAAGARQRFEPPNLRRFSNPWHMNELPSPPDTERWQRERSFFDRQAQTSLQQLEPIPAETLRRYGTLRRPYFNPEYRYRVVGDLRGKRVLEVGCGEGENSVVLAKLGAHVTGIDISQGAIDTALERADLNGVAERVAFVCAPIELASFEPATFDIIWGEAILHHLLADLDMVLSHLTKWAKPDATILFAEPVALSRTLRRVRLMLPVHTEATPDERPLEAGELALVSRYLRDAEFRYFEFLGRLDRFIVSDTNFEKSSPARRAISTALHLIDYGLLSLPGVSRLGGVCVMHGRPARAGS